MSDPRGFEVLQMRTVFSRCAVVMVMVTVAGVIVRAVVVMRVPDIATDVRVAMAGWYNAGEQYRGRQQQASRRSQV